MKNIINYILDNLYYFYYFLIVIILFFILNLIYIKSKKSRYITRGEITKIIILKFVKYLLLYLIFSLSLSLLIFNLKDFKIIEFKIILIILLSYNITLSAYLLFKTIKKQLKRTKNINNLIKERIPIFVILIIIFILIIILKDYLPYKIFQKYKITNNYNISLLNSNNFKTNNLLFFIINKIKIKENFIFIFIKIILIIINAFLEEFLFRNYLIFSRSKYLKIKYDLNIEDDKHFWIHFSILFAILHFQINLFKFFQLFIFSYFMYWVRKKTNSLIFPSLFHAIDNIFIKIFNFI